VAEDALRLVIDIEDDGDPEERAAALQAIRRELLDSGLDIDVIDPEPGEGPEGAKGSELLAHLGVAGQSVAIHASVVLVYEMFERWRHSKIVIRGPHLEQRISVRDTDLERAHAAIDEWAALGTEE